MSSDSAGQKADAEAVLMHADSADLEETEVQRKVPVATALEAACAAEQIHAVQVDWRRHEARPQMTDARGVQKIGETGDVTGELIGKTDDLTQGIAAQQYPAAVWSLASGFAASRFAHESLLGRGLALRPLGMLGVPALHL